MSTAVNVLAPAFTDMVHGPQQAFRCLLEAMSHPGHIYEIPTPETTPGPLSQAMTAVVLTVLDHDTPVWLDPILAKHAAVADYIRFYCGSPLLTSSGDAAFCLVDDAQSIARLDGYRIGDPLYPETSATIVAELGALTGGPAVQLRGPGLRDYRDFDPIGLPDGFWRAWSMNNVIFPQGVDMIFTCGNELTALPRSVSAEG